MGSQLQNYLSGTDDPSSVATNGQTGQLYAKLGASPAVYQKQDDGLTTNWTLVGTSTKSFVYARATGANQTGITALTKILFATADENVNGEYDTSTSVYTATAARKLAVVSKITGVCAATFVTNVLIVLNGSTQVALSRLVSAGADETMTVDWAGSVGIGDTLEVQVTASSSYDIDNNNSNLWSTFSIIEQ